MMAYIYYNPYELYHHGIKGMKWGVRRFQNADGSLKPAGEKRYYGNTSGSSKSTGTESSSNTTDQKHSKEYNKAKLARNFAIGVAAVAGTAILAYGASQYIKQHKDLVISGGEIMQRITTQEEGGKVYDNFYAAVGKHDQARYKAFMPKYHLNPQEEGEHLLKQLEAKTTMKIASPANANKVFKDVIQGDPKAKELFKYHGINRYEDFNRNIVAYRHDTNLQNYYNKFRDAMEKAGYAGVIDVNDRKYSGYNAKNPAIIFRSAAAEVKKMESLPRQNLSAEKAEDGKALAESLMQNKSLVIGSLAAVGLASANSASDSSQTMKEEEKKKSA